MATIQRSSVKKNSLLHYLRNHWALYAMLLPGVVVIVIFKFLPYYGIQIAFKDYNIFAGANPIAAIGASKWAGMKHFVKLFSSSSFLQVLRNTLVLNGLRILFLFPIPIIVALFLVEVRSPLLMRLTQTMIFVPYFFSWVIIYGIFSSMLGSYGMINSVFTDDRNKAMAYGHIAYDKHYAWLWTARVKKSPIMWKEFTEVTIDTNNNRPEIFVPAYFVFNNKDEYAQNNGVLFNDLNDYILQLITGVKRLDNSLATFTADWRNNEGEVVRVALQDWYDKNFR
jgi:ABC-type polysaccharide transport system permease subunit